MSDDKYRGRKDPYIGQQRSNPANTHRDTHSQREHDSPREARSHYHDPHHDNPDNINLRDTDRRDANRNQMDSDAAYRGPQTDERLPGQNRERHRDHYADQYRGNNEPRGVNYPVKFHGKTSEYFKIWIVNVFLTIITLYIYSAWAKVRTKRYFYGNTTIDGSSFEYHAQGSQLVIGRLIAAALVITYTIFQGIDLFISGIAFGLIAVMFPWAVWRSLRFNARASSFRNIRFGFDGMAMPPYTYLLIVPAIVIGLFAAGIFLISTLYDLDSFEQLTNLAPQTQLLISGGITVAFFLAAILLVPLLHKKLISYSLNNHRYGTAKFSASIKTGRIYGIYLLTALITVVALAIIGAVISGVFQFFYQATRFLDNSDLLGRLEPYMEIILGIGAYLVIIPITAVGVAFFRSSIRNHRYNATTIDSNIKLNSSTTTWSLWWLNISNLLILIFSLGLGYPYTKIRSARYFARRTSVTVYGGLNSFTEREKNRLHAMGEEMADAFDVEFDIGV